MIPKVMLENVSIFHINYHEQPTWFQIIKRYLQIMLGHVKSCVPTLLKAHVIVNTYPPILHNYPNIVNYLLLLKVKIRSNLITLYSF